MKTFEIVGDESVLERAKKYKIPLRFPAKRETTELPVQERETRFSHAGFSLQSDGSWRRDTPEWMTFEERMRRKLNGW